MTHASVFLNRVEGTLLQPDLNEVYRYMGYQLKDRMNLDDGIKPLVLQIVEQFQKIIIPQALYVSFPLEIQDDFLNFSGNTVQSRELAKYLKDCKEIYLFAATIGPKVDQQIQKFQRIDPVKAVIMQATGAMFIETYCDYLCNIFLEEVQKENKKIKNRFSPGFADVKLDVQKLFFSLLDCKKIGLSLMDSLIMAPEKSVTAFVGVKENA